MKTTTNPHMLQTAQDDPFQQLGWLHVAKATMILIAVKQCGVELILSCGLSILIRSSEIVKTRLKSNLQFATCLKLGGSFPSLRLNVVAINDFHPRWSGELNEGQRTLDPEDGSSDEERTMAADLAAELREREQAGSSTSQPAGASGPGHVEDDSKPKDAPQPIKPVSLPEPAYLPPERHHGGGRGH